MASIFKKGDILEGRIEFLEFISEGGQAEVWSVRNLEYRENTELALKVRGVPWDQRGDASFVSKNARWNQEITLLGSLKHRFVIDPKTTVDGQFEKDGETFAIFGILMNLATEGNLENFVYGDLISSLSPLDRLKFMERLLIGLKAIHLERIVHNDIKPQNILVSKQAVEYIPIFADFGFSFRQGDKVERGGTFPYMAPELLTNQGDPSFKSDIFSMGIVFSEIMNGRHPLEGILHHGDQQKALLGYFSTHEYVEFSTSEKSKNRALVDMIQQMCSRDPAMRPSVGELLDSMEDITNDTRSETSVRLIDSYPEFVDKFQWSDGTHKLFGEREHVIFCKGSTPDVDPKFIADRLARKKIFGFTLLRILGSSDYFLRIWCRDSDLAVVDEVLEAYKIERPGAAFEMFDPTLRWPKPSETLDAEWDSPSKFLDKLTTLTDPAKSAGEIAIILAAAKRAGVVLGKTKSARERTKRKVAIRAVCRVKLGEPIPPRLASVMGDQLWSQIGTIRDVTELEILADSGVGAVPSQFILILELADFHKYIGVLTIVADTLSALSQNGGIEFRSSFEMDPKYLYDSYDGRLFYELFRYRVR